MIKVLSLFDGIAGGRQALKELNIDCEYYGSEIDKYAIQVAKNNHPDIIYIGDVKGIEFEDGYIFYNQNNDPMKNGGSFKNNIDLLIGGSPCQDLSIAKKDRKGLNGERSSLFYEYLRILNGAKPKYFILENVASMPNDAKNEITKNLFGIEPILINSSLLTAQQRKRLYWVGVLQADGNYKKIEINQPQDRQILLKNIIENGIAPNIKNNCLTATYYKCSGLRDYLRGSRQIIVEPICVASRGRNIVNGKRIDIKGAKTKQRLEPNLSYKTNTLTTVAKDNLIIQPIKLGYYNKGSQGDRIYSVKGKSVCLSANGGGRGAKTGLYKIDLPDGDYIVRKLTPIECARLQGFPDNYCQGISNTQAYKCFGNSFTVPIIKHILQQLNLS